MGRATFLLPIFILLNFGKAAAQLRLQPLPNSGVKDIAIKLLPQNFYNSNLSFLCTKEIQLQKLISLPLFIRLGSKDYVDYLEKKPNAIANRR